MATIFNPELVNDVARRRIVVFIGSGVSASSKTRSGVRLKDWVGFLQHAMSKITDSADHKLVEGLIAEKDYLLACEVIKESLDKTIWSDLVYEEFSQVGIPSALHEAISSLGHRITLTTNFDKLLENTFADTSGATHYPITITEIKDDVFQILKDDKNYIIKIHGTVDDPSSMIFDKTDYAKKAFNNWAYSEFIDSLLIIHTFLFIGFSMADPAISLLIERYAQKFPNARPHYIFQSAPINPKLVEVSKRLRKLYIMEYDPVKNHEKLPELVRELANQAALRRREILAAELSSL